MLSCKKGMITNIIHIPQANDDTMHIMDSKMHFPPHILTSLKLGYILFYNKLAILFLLNLIRIMY